MTSNTAVGAQVSGSTPLIRISGNLFFCFLSRAGRNAREEPTLVDRPQRRHTYPSQPDSRAGSKAAASHGAAAFVVKWHRGM